MKGRSFAEVAQAWLPGVPALLLVAVLVVAPYANVVVTSLSQTTPGGGFTWTTMHYANELSDPFFYETLFWTLFLGLLSAAICLVVGYPVALHLARSQSRYTGFLYALVLSPLLIGVVVRTFAWLLILSDNGVANQILRQLGLSGLTLMNNTLGVTIGLVHILLPFMILSLMNSIQGIDPKIESAARSLGASRLRTFIRITLPLSVPGIVSGSLLVFLLGVSAYITPLALGGGSVKTIPMLVVQSLLDSFQWSLGSALALLLAISASIVMVPCLLLANRWRKFSE